MKLYVAMCSLSLLAGSAIGHFSGKISTQASFLDDCAATSFVVLEDNKGNTQRHFHCFEIDTDSQPGHSKRRSPEPVPMI